MEMNTMPLLRSICIEGVKYDDIVVLNINHDVRNTYCFSAELAKKFGKVIQIGASYSPSSPEERAPFSNGVYYYSIPNRKGGFSLERCEKPLRIVSPDFTNSIDMLIMIAVAKDCLEDIKKGKKLFIIEDGGYHSSTVDNLEVLYPELEGKIIGSVEQTTSGTKILSSRKTYNYPSFSIARSEIKMCLESVFIGQRIVEELSNFLYATNHFLNYSNIMIIGYGIFGRSVAKKLSTYHCNVCVYDTNPTICKAAEAEGYPASSVINSETFTDNMVIIGMTGNKSFGEKELHDYLLSDANDLILSSGSSKDIEFKDILNIIDGVYESDISFSLIEDAEYHRKYLASDGTHSKFLTIIASGMPVNFCRKGAVSLTDKMIDLDFSEMALCALTIIDSADNLKKMLYLLGEPIPQIKVDERKLMLQWFHMIGVEITDAELDDYINIHPCKDYLRRKTYEKIAQDKLI